MYLLFHVVKLWQSVFCKMMAPAIRLMWKDLVSLLRHTSHYHPIPVHRLFEKIQFREWLSFHTFYTIARGGKLEKCQFLSRHHILINSHHILLLSNSTTCFSIKCHTARHRCEQCGEDRLHMVTLCGLHHWRVNRWTMHLLILYKEGKQTENLLMAKSSKTSSLFKKGTIKNLHTKSGPLWMLYSAFTLTCPSPLPSFFIPIFSI